MCTTPHPVRGQQVGVRLQTPKEGCEAGVKAGAWGQNGDDAFVGHALGQRQGSGKREPDTEGGHGQLRLVVGGDTWQRRGPESGGGGEDRVRPTPSSLHSTFAAYTVTHRQRKHVGWTTQYIPTHDTAIHTAMPARAMQAKPHQMLQAGLTGLRCPLWSTWPRRLGGQRGWPEDSATAANDTQKNKCRPLLTGRLHAQTFHALLTAIASPALRAACGVDCVRLPESPPQRRSHASVLENHVTTVAA